MYIYIPGWWYTYPFEKYEFVNWDDYSQLNGQIKNVPNRQPNMILLRKAPKVVNCDNFSENWVILLFSSIFHG